MVVASAVLPSLVVGAATLGLAPTAMRVNQGVTAVLRPGAVPAAMPAGGRCGSRLVIDAEVVMLHGRTAWSRPAGRTSTPAQAIAMPAFPIVDSHVHLWDPKRIPLRFGADVPTLNRPHLIADYDAARGDVAVEAMVFLECDVAVGRHLDEAAMVAEIAAGEPRLKAMVAHAPLEKGEAVAADLDALARFPLLRGIRRLLQGEADLPAVLNDDFAAALNLLPRYNLHFEICVYHHQLGAIVDLVRRLPNVTFMLDHIAKPPIKAGGLEPWRTRMAELAALPNVMCKLSGLITEADHASWQPADLRPYIDCVVDAFGFDRLVFGSDWPVLTLAGGLPQWVAILDDALAGASADDLRYFWLENARAFYRLDES